MRDKVLFINEDYFRKYFATRKTLDDEQIVSTIRRVQVTSVVDLLSTKLYEYIHDKLDNQEAFNEVEARLFDDLQLFMGLETSIKYDLQSPERGANEGWDRSVSSTEGEVKIVSARINRIINSDTELSSIANQSTEVAYDADPIANQGGGFYFIDSY